MKIDLYQVDAFTEKLFSGNPAAVCPLDEWLPDARMQQIAAENNLSETAFFVREPVGYRLRWFTPETEVELCGHATLASAYVIWKYLGVRGPLTFETISGTLRAEGDPDEIILDFPALDIAPAARVPPALLEGLGQAPESILASGEARGSGFYMCVYCGEADIRALAPDMQSLATLGLMGVVVTAPGFETDMASRCFAPSVGIPEDPVTGSIHCFLTPYWAGRLGKPKLTARQASRRGGTLRCELIGDRVRIGGQAVCYMRGTIHLPG
jgi:PhzF family phenazine biosynthesis protein